MSQLLLLLLQADSFSIIKAVSCAGDMDDLLELLFPDDPQLSFKQLHMQDPATITSRLATRGEP
jgi:hypothetical protein